MSLPGYPDGFNPGWWRIVTATPPVYTLSGTLTNSSPVVSMGSAFSSPANPAPLVGQQVSGTGIPAGATVASVNLTAPSFTLSADATASGLQSLTIGAEPVALADAKAWARVEYDDDDSLIGDIIQMARERIEADLKRALLTQQKTLYFMAFPWSGYFSLAVRGAGLNPWWLPFAQGVIKLPYPTLQTVDLVQYVDTNGDLQTIDPSQYLYTPYGVPGRLQPQWGDVWPVARPQIDAVQITFTCGYGLLATNVPASTRLAMRSLIAASYENREAAMEGELTITPLYEKLAGAEDYGYYG